MAIQEHQIWGAKLTSQVALWRFSVHCALILLARPALQEIKQEQKELRQEQNITKAILQQVVTDDQLQDQVRFEGSTPTVVLNGRLLLVGLLATFRAWSGPSGHQVLLAASILS